jgi:hypothetical protein
MFKEATVRKMVRDPPLQVRQSMLNRTPVACELLQSALKQRTAPADIPAPDVSSRHL